MRGFLFLAGLAVAAAVSSAASTDLAPPEILVPRAIEVSVPSPEAVRHELPGGAVAFVAPDDAVPLVEVIVVLPAGEDRDPPGARGTAGLTAAMLRRGGAGELGPDAFDRRAADLAAEIDGFSGAYRAGAVLDVGAWRLEEGLDLLFAMLAEPRFDSERFGLLRASLAEGIETGLSDPEVVGSRHWERLTAIPGEVLATPLDPDAVRALEPGDLRVFHRRHWRPDRIVFAVSGAVDPETVTESLARRLRTWSDRVDPPASPEPAGSSGEEVPDREAPSGLHLVDFPASGAVVLAGHRLEPAAKLSREERYAAVLLEELVAGGGVNRFVGRLRVGLGLVYGVDSELALAPDRPGRWLSLFHCEADRAGAALAAWREEVERLRNEPVGETTLSAARTAVIGRLLSRFDTASGVAGTWAEDALLGRPHDFWAGLPAGLAAVTPERLRAVARKLLDPDRTTVVVVGPRSRVSPALAAAPLPRSWRPGTGGQQPER